MNGMYSTGKGKSGKKMTGKKSMTGGRRGC